MNEDVLNIEIRKYLKKVGINSQREMEKAIHEALASGRLTGNERLSVSMHLELPGVDLSCTVDGTIALAE